MTGLTVSLSYAHNEVTIPNSLNPFPQANGAFITVPIPIYQVYTPKESGSVAVDYERRFGFARLQLHFDGNYDSGYYANYTDPGFNTATGAVTVKQPKGDKAFVTNGRIALTDIALPNGAVLTASVWSRNLLNEQHVFYNSYSPLTGGTGFFNEPRTVGAELNVKY
jgi:iron complex outermembrane receptor protein